MKASEQRTLEQQKQLRILETWKAMAKRSPDGRYYVGAGCYIVYVKPEESCD